MMMMMRRILFCSEKRFPFLERVPRQWQWQSLRALDQYWMQSQREVQTEKQRDQARCYSWCPSRKKNEDGKKKKKTFDEDSVGSMEKITW